MIDITPFFRKVKERLFKNRRLKTDILFESMVILLMSVILIISYSYYSNTKATIEQSHHFLKNTSIGFKDKIVKTLLQVENVVRIFTPLLSERNLHKTLGNFPLNKAMAATLSSYPYITALYFGTPDGLFFQVLSPKSIEAFAKMSGSRLPENTTSVIKVIDHSTQAQEVERGVNELWYYVQGGRSLTAPRIGDQTAYDPRKRPWYQITSKGQNLVWSNIYVFASNFRGDAGITASLAMIDRTGALKGVFCADITLKSFSELLAEDKISTHAVSYVIDESDHIIAASDGTNSSHIKNGEFNLISIKELGRPLLEQSIELYKAQKGKEDFIHFENNGKEYIAVFEDFPKLFSNNWKALIIAPVDDFVGKIKENRNRTLGYSLLILLIAFIMDYLLARRISRPITQLAAEAERIRDLKLDGKVQIQSHIREIEELSTAMMSLKTTMQSFSYYIPRTLVQKLLNKKQSVHIGGKAKEVTLMFSDVEGFTTVSENSSPEKLVISLSEYFQELTDIIMKNEGTVDKYIGDAIMAFWGAPLTDRHHAQNACRSALLCQKRLLELNRLWKREDRPVFKTRMGIHSGEVIVGNIGSSERMNYTAIGDSVNLASRLESLNKFYGTYIIASETVYDHVKDIFLFRSLDRVAVKGKAKAVRIYELIGQLKGDESLYPTDEQLEFCQVYEKAYKLYLTRQWKEAREAFEDIVKTLRIQDKSVQMYIERSEEFMKKPPPQDWDGATAMTQK